MSISIRKYVAGEEVVLRELFFETIHNVNSSDYTEQQVNVWAPQQYNAEDWLQRIKAIDPYVAIVDGEIAGYADLQRDGYIDHFYCHWRFQGQGVGRALMKTLLSKGRTLGIKRFYSQVSITARPFFERYGFLVLKQQRVSIGDIELTNFKMEKCQS
jgi:putative acetyltransferase